MRCWPSAWERPCSCCPEDRARHQGNSLPAPNSAEIQTRRSQPNSESGMARLPISKSFVENSVFGVAAFVLSSALIRMLTSGNTDLVTAGDRRFEFVLMLIYLAIL